MNHPLIRFLTGTVFILSSLISCCAAATLQNIREPAAAGRFYPADAHKLTLSIQAYLKDARPPSGNKPIAIISPHAGYLYSGQICADVFNQAAGYAYDTIVLIGTNHTTANFRQISVYSHGGYRTPLGLVPVDTEMAGKLFQADSDCVFKAEVHAAEHSNEVMLPFIQHLFPQAKIVPVIIGQPNLALCKKFGHALAQVIRGRSVLVVASSDLSHYPRYDDARKVDRTLLNTLLKMDPAQVQAVIQKQMHRGVPQLATCACGEGPILTTLSMINALGDACPQIISYANSGDSPLGQRDRVVGYGAVAFFPTGSCRGKPLNLDTKVKSVSAELSDTHKKSLLRLARKAIKQMLESDTAPLVRDFDARLEQKQGAFVTLKKHGALRGCIGRMIQDMPLCQTVGAMAIAAAFNDYRFRPLQLKELDEVDIEISVLTPFTPVAGPDAIQIGRDGVLIRKQGHSAVFLPQVAVEQGWDRDQTLDQLCLKADLEMQDWRNNARLYIFQAVVFNEARFRLQPEAATP